MIDEVDLNTIFGKVIGFARVSPLSNKACVIVKVNSRTLRIPVDHRQIQFIGNEYPVGSIVELEYDGRWRIRSKMAPVEFDVSHVIPGDIWQS